MAHRTLLLNWIYYRPVGHAVEAFAAAADFVAADPDLEVHVLVNSHSPSELGGNCPWVAATHAVDVDEVVREGADAPCLADVPTTWDYVVESERLLHNRPSYTDAFIRCHEVIRQATVARLWSGIRGGPGEGTSKPPPYEPYASYRMVPKADARAWASRYAQSEPVISVVLGGSSAEPIYPRVDWWASVLSTLVDTFPGVRLLVTGVGREVAGRTATAGYTESDVARLLDRVAGAVNCYDVGLQRQLALVEVSDVLISPHTGFAFLAPSVGTPWLAVSGVRWPDLTYASVPFYAALPRCPEYPCFRNMLKECSEALESGRQVACMGQALDERIPDVVRGVRLLLRSDFDLAAAVDLYEARALERGICMERLYSLGVVKQQLR